MNRRADGIWIRFPNVLPQKCIGALRKQPRCRGIQICDSGRRIQNHESLDKAIEDEVGVAERLATMWVRFLLGVRRGYKYDFSCADEGANRGYQHGWRYGISEICAGATLQRLCVFILAVPYRRDC